MARQPDDEPFAFEPTQAVGGLPAGVRVAQQGGDGPDQGRVVEPDEQAAPEAQAERLGVAVAALPAILEWIPQTADLADQSGGSLLGYVRDVGCAGQL